MPRDELKDIYSKCFPEKNAEDELKALGKNFRSEVLDERSFIIYSIVSENEAEIIDVGTIPQFRGKGSAQKLIEKTIDYLKNNNISTIYLEVAENNIPALKLYEKCGFEKYNTRKDYYKTSSGRINAVLMKKSI